MGDGELEAFKALNLAEVARAYGYALDHRLSSRANLVMRHPDGDKVVIATGEDGHGIFYSTRTDRSGSVIDFVMFRESCNLGHARKRLRAYTGAYVPSPSAPPLPKPEPIPKDRAAVIAAWHRLTPYEGGYLEGRGLTPDTIAAFSHHLRLDERGNVAFRHDDLQGLCGWEVKNDGFTGFVRGGSKGLFAMRVGVGRKIPPPRLIVAESAIDAMSYYQLDPAPALVLSFGGSLSPQQREILQDVLTRYPGAEVLSATDADERGDEYAELIAAIRPDALRKRPPEEGQDWNEVIQPTR